MRSVVLLLGIGAFMLWQYGRTAAGFLVEVTNFDIFFNRATVMSVPARLRMRVVNPTPTSVNVDSYAGRVLLNGKEIAIFNGTPFTMPANGEKNIEVAVSIGSQALLSAAPGLLRGAAGGTMPGVTIEGTLTAAGVPIGFTKEIVINRG